MKSISVAILTLLIGCCFARNAAGQTLSDSANTSWANWRPYQTDTTSKHTKRAKARKLVARKGKDSASVRPSGFLSTDRYFEKYRAWSPYVYVQDNPMRYTDPSGDTIVVNNDGGNHDLVTPIKEIGQTARGSDVVSFLQDMPMTVNIEYKSIPKVEIAGEKMFIYGATTPQPDGKGSVRGVLIRIDPDRTKNLSQDQIRRVVAEEVFHAFQISHDPQGALKEAAAEQNTPYAQRPIEVTAKSAAEQMMDQFYLLRNSGQIDNNQIFLGTAEHPQ